MFRLPSVGALVALLLLVALAATATPAQPRVAVAAPTATAKDTAHIETVRIAYDLLLDQFYRQPSPAALLRAAWGGASDALREAGVRDRPAAPALRPGREDAWADFAPRYPELVARSPTDLSATEIAFAAVKAMAESLNESHTAFLAPEQYARFSASLSGEEEGVGLGVIFALIAGRVVAEVAPGGPAERRGVRPGDAVLAVNGRDVSRASDVEFARALGGPAGTELRLTLERPEEGRVEATVTRGPFRFPDFEARVLGDGTGYLRLRSFSDFLRAASDRPNVLQELDAALARFEAVGVTRWVLDLRGNPGGFVATANELVGRFLPNVATIVNENDRGDRGVELAPSRGFAVQRPLAVLVDEDSASSSESVASTLREHGRAVVVGRTTAGVLATAGVFPLPDGAALYIALARVLTARENVLVDEKGITPDVSVRDSRGAADYAVGRDPQLEAAIRALAGRTVDQPAPSPLSGQLNDATSAALLALYLPGADEAPPPPAVAAPEALGDLPLTDPNRYASGAEDPFALARTAQARGWQGSYGRYYAGPAGLNGPWLAASIDLYATVSGAVAALNSNDFPRTQREALVPEQLGEGTVAYLGRWLGAGAALIQVRVGRAVVSALYSTNPGEEDFAPALELARLVVARLERAPLPAEAPAIPALTP